MRRTTRRFSLASRTVAGSERSGRDFCNSHTQRSPTPCNVLWAQTAGWPRTFGPLAFLAASHLQSPSSRRIDTSSRTSEAVIGGTVRSDSGHAGSPQSKFKTGNAIHLVPRAGLVLSANCLANYLMSPVVVGGKRIFASHVLAENEQSLG